MKIRVALLALCLVTCSPPPPQPNTLQPDPPTFQKATPVSGGTKLGWRTAESTDSDWDLTLVARYTSTPDGKPPASVPAVGDAFGSGKVVYVGPETSFTDTELPASCTTFTYQFWSHDKGGHWSGAAVIAVTLPGGLAPPAVPPSAFTATRIGDNAVLTWTAAPASTTTRVVRNLGTPPLSPDQGTSVYDGPATTTQEPVSALPAGQTIFYAAFACNECGACAQIGASAMLLIAREDAGVIDAGPDDPDGGSPLQPSNISAAISANGQNVVVSWTNPPASTGFTQVKVLRSLNTYPSGPGDTSATTVFTGLGTTASERVDRLLPSVAGAVRVYRYVAYGCANATCEQHGARADFTLTVTQALRGGGYNIWWRHASASTCGDRTDLGACSCTNGVCTNCPASNWWKSCVADPPACTMATARQLTPPTSTNETTLIHDQFASKGIAIGRVMSSEMCRGIQTAQGMNFGPSIEQVKELTYFVYDEANRCTNTYGLLNEVPAQGTNTAMISHAGFSCPIIDSLNWSECAIFKPNPTGTATFIMRVPHSQWSTLP